MGSHAMMRGVEAATMDPLIAGCALQCCFVSVAALVADEAIRILGTLRLQLVVHTPGTHWSECST